MDPCPAFPSRTLVALALAATLFGCGGGGSGDGGSDDPTQTVVVTEPDEETIQTNGGISGGLILVSDLGDGTSTRALWTFPLPATFAPATEVVSATLHTSVLSSNQRLFTLTGPLVLDHVDSTVTDQFAKRNARALLDAFAVVAVDGTPGRRVVDVTAAVRADVAAGRTGCRLRVRHQGGDTNGDEFGDFTRLGSTNEPPSATLEITFR